MTNAQIIKSAAKAAGIEETLHTYGRWERMGLKVRKGEHAALKVKIWQKRRVSKDDEEDEGKWYLRTTAFFAESQVEPICG